MRKALVILLTTGALSFADTTCVIGNTTMGDLASCSLSTSNQSATANSTLTELSSGNDLAFMADLRAQTWVGMPGPSVSASAKLSQTFNIYLAGSGTGYVVEQGNGWGDDSAAGNGLLNIGVSSILGFGCSSGSGTCLLLGPIKKAITLGQAYTVTLDGNVSASGVSGSVEVGLNTTYDFYTADGTPVAVSLQPQIQPNVLPTPEPSACLLSFFCSLAGLAAYAYRRKLVNSPAAR